MRHKGCGLVLLILVDKYTIVKANDAKFGVFQCDSVPSCPIMYRGHGVKYICSGRPEIPTCKGPPAAVPDAMSRGACKRKCHFNPRCTSFAWVAEDTVCRQCASMNAQENSRPASYDANLPYVANSEGIQSKLVFGFVDTEPKRFELDGKDYIQEGYIETNPNQKSLDHVLIAPDARQLRISFDSPYCIYEPFVRRSTEGYFDQSWTIAKQGRLPTYLLLTLLTILGIMSLGLMLYQKKNREPLRPRKSNAPQRKKL